MSEGFVCHFFVECTINKSYKGQKSLNGELNDDKYQRPAGWAEAVLE